MKFIATATKFTEDFVMEEIDILGGKSVTKVKSGIVQFESDLKKALDITFNIRTCRRIVLPLKSFYFQCKESFYSECRDFEWEDYLTHKNIISVRIKGGDQNLRNTSYSALLLKDAIVDRIRDKSGLRPSIDKKNPQIEILGVIKNGFAEISLCLGRALHKRGYRVLSTKGALNETLAAVMLKAGKYDGKEPLYDPMAGSGTIGIEAALIACNIAPGLLWKEERGFFSFYFVDRQTKKEIIKDAKEKIVKPFSKIYLSDINPYAIESAKKNASLAGVYDFIDFNVINFFELKKNDDYGLIVSNIPYGDDVKVEENYDLFLKKIGDKLKRDFINFKAILLLFGRESAKKIGLHAFKKNLLYNGNLEVMLCLYDLYEGSRKKRTS